MITAVICGPTSTGKSELAYKIALKNRYEIISADSRQIYRGLEIGTGQVPSTWKENVPHHLMGFLPLEQTYSDIQFSRDVNELLTKNAGTKYILTGGTGLYIQSVLYPRINLRPAVPEKIIKQVSGLLNENGSIKAHEELKKKDPAVAEKIHPNDRFRIAKAWENYLWTGISYKEFDRSEVRKPSMLKVPVYHITLDRAVLYERINKRVEDMFRQGWVDEVKTFFKNGNFGNLPCFKALGYCEIIKFLRGENSLSETIMEVQRKTRKYAKKQNTFFKSQIKGAKMWNKPDFVEYLENFNWNLPEIL